MAEQHEIVAGRVAGSPFGNQLEVRVAGAGPGRVTVRMPYSRERTTGGDIVHGGAIASLVDIAATAAMWSGVEEPEAHRGTTISLTLNFLEAARGCDLIAEAAVLRRGGSVSVGEVTVRDPEGRRIAEALVTYKLSRERPAPAPPAAALQALFAGKPREEQMAVLAQLERAGAGLYQALAAGAKTDEERERLGEAAEREQRNAELLERMHRR
jgi:uncharacterized protein (TIGR00369 family)